MSLSSEPLRKAKNKKGPRKWTAELGALVSSFPCTHLPPGVWWHCVLKLHCGLWFAGTSLNVVGLV
jgi:hypothetical protein